jgi:hypothetical protein
VIHENEEVFYLNFREKQASYIQRIGRSLFLLIFQVLGKNSEHESWHWVQNIFFHIEIPLNFSL